MIGSITAQGDQAADVGFFSRIKMSSHFVRSVGDGNQKLSKSIEQSPFNLLKYLLSAAVR